MRGGELARLGLLYAMELMFGQDRARDIWIARRENRGHSHWSTKNDQVHPFGSSRAGFKLIKKMCRRPNNTAWQKTHRKAAVNG